MYEYVEKWFQGKQDDWLRYRKRGTWALNCTIVPWR